MAATYLDFTTDPTADFAANPIVTAKNADTTTDTTFTGTVTLNLTTGTGTPTATLTGTVSMAAIAGVATWTNTQALAITDNGTYTLTATSGTLTAAESAAFAYTLAVERNALSEIRSAARLRLGILPTATTEEDDPDLTLWPALITASRDDVLRKALNSTRLLSDEEVLVRVTGAREYDLSRMGFVLVNRLGSFGEKWADAVAARFQEALA
jgi:hypothetical protein